MKYICTNCEYQGKRKIIKAGSRTFEIIMWVVFLIPGPFYSLWRWIGQKYVCPKCGKENMVKENSLLGKKLVDKINEDLSPESIAKIPDMWEKDRLEYKAKLEDKEQEKQKKEPEEW